MTQEELLLSIGLNIEKERIRLNYTQNEMAKKLNMSLTSYKAMIKGESKNLSVYSAFLVHEVTGKMFFELCGIDEPYFRMMKKYRDLSETQKNYIDAIIDFEYEFAVSPSNNEDYIPVMIPTCCFEDGILWDSFYTEHLNISAYSERLNTSIHFGIRITSNHFHPVYVMGDIILIQKRPPKDGDLAVFVQKSTGRAYLRKFKQTSPCQLVPIVDYGETFTVDPYNIAEMSDWIKVGVVITRIRPK